MTPSDSLIAALASRNPLEQALTALKTLISQANATGGAILRPGDPPTQWIGLNVHGLPLKNFDRHVQALSVAGARTVDGKTTALIRNDAGVIGLLYLEGAPSFDQARYSGYLEAFRAAITASDAPRPQALDAATLARVRGGRGDGTTQERRDVLVELLKLAKGNIAEVARELHVTRRTVYMRMKSLGIMRPAKP